MRRAQVTMFIILGLLILLSVALVAYFSAQKTTAPVERAVTVPEDVEPVYDYVSECLSSVAYDGIRILGAQGGFINIPGIIQNTPTSYVPNDPLGVTKVPLWYFDGEDRSPNLDYMGAELSRYIKARLPLCINNFTGFERFDVVQKGEPLPIVTFTSNDVVVELDWPLQVTTVGRTTSLDRFVVKQDVKLKDMWLLADSIMRTENEKSWFENLTVDFLSMDPDIPMNGIEFKCGAMKWNLYSLKEHFSKLLTQNIPDVRVAHTNYPPPNEPVGVYEDLKADKNRIENQLEAGSQVTWPASTPVDAFEFNRMMMDTGFPDTDLKVGFYFMPEWDLKFVGKPNSGGVLSSADVKGARQFLRFLCINSWHFTYDVIYPVKVFVRDDSAFGGEGFVFQFAFPVVVKSNAAARDVFSVRKFKDATVYPDFCKELGNDEYDIRAVGFVENSPVAVELDDVRLLYRCLNFECPLGSTYSDGSGFVRLYTYLPEGCSNPLIAAKKEGYVDSEVFVKPGLNEIEMTKLEDFNLSVSVHPYLSDAKQWLPVERLGDNQHVTVSISAVDYDFDQFFIYPNNSSVQLVYGDANYDVDLLLMKGNNVIGGYSANNISLNYEDFAGKNMLELSIVEFRPYPTTSDEKIGLYSFLYEGGMYGDVPYSERLVPVFK